MKALHLALTFLPCIVNFSWDLPRTHIYPISFSPECEGQSRNCASILRYTNCAQVKNWSDICDIRKYCIEKEFVHLLQLACAGEQYLLTLSITLDSICANRLDSPVCNLGLVSMNIFDFGNITQQHILCRKVQESFTAKCISAVHDNAVKYYCTPEQYGNFLRATCTGESHESRNSYCANVSSSFVLLSSVAIILSKLFAAYQ